VLRAVATYPDGRRSEDRVETTGPAVALRLTPHTSPRGFVMDGADIALVDVEAVDAKGRRVPNASNMVHFSLSGPAEWRGGIAQGDSSGKKRAEAPSGQPLSTQPPPPGGVTEFAGAARDEDNYILSSKLPVEAGINRVLLRAGTHSGIVQLTAAAAGLKSATLTIPTVMPPSDKGGLSLDFPTRYQPDRLTRGPTPPGPSYRVSRSTALPVAVVAGSNQADAQKSIDDDEVSRWVSDGHPETAWIEYRFAAPVKLSQIDIKLVGWRSRAYPLRITLDGRTVWSGETERSLGYAHLSFAPVTGRVLRITQTGPVVDRDAFGNIVELKTARAAGDTGADAVPPGWRLAIVEADFHGPAGE